MEGRLDRLADKFANLNEQVAREQLRARIQETLDQWVLEGKLAYDPETGEYTNLFEAEEGDQE